MKRVFSTSTKQLLNYGRRGALLLALAGLGPVARGQSFGPASTYPTGAGSVPEGLALGDMNGDGQLDIVTSNTHTSQVAVLLGQAGGGFAAPSWYPTGGTSATWDVELGDLNKDGRLDMVVPNSNQHTIGVLLGQAGGGFSAVSTYSTGAGNSPSDAALGDVNGDGYLDIATVINGANYGVAVLLGQAGGGFTAPGVYPTGASSYPSDVAIGDVNGDGRPDLVATLQGPQAIAVLLGQPAGGFAAATMYATGAQNVPYGVVLGDVNSDGRLDIVASLGFNNRVGVLLGQATGGFAPLSSYPTGAGPLRVALGDVNGDGRLDILTAHFNDNSVGVLLGQAGGFGLVRTYLTNPGVTAVANIVVGDVNKDGRLDLVAANAPTNTVGVLLNTGTYLATAHPLVAEVALYPNPTHDTFTVQLPAGTPAGPAELLNALGQVVRRPAGTAPRFTVETAGLAPGIYTLRMRLGAATVARRVVVE